MPTVASRDAEAEGIGPLRPALFLAIAIGGASSAAWVFHAHLPVVLSQARAFNWFLALPAIALTLANVCLRFIRWQFFLRRVGVLLPVRESARIFVAGLAMVLTPAYAGEVLKAWLVRRAAPASYGYVAGVVLSERVFDGAALAFVGGSAAAIAADWLPAVGLFALGTGALLALALVGKSLGRLFPGAARGWGSMMGTARTVPLDQRTFAIGFGLSLAAWLCGCLTLAAVCRGIGLPIATVQAVVTYAVSTLLGAATLLPAGVGVMGTAVVLRLEAAGAMVSQAVLAALLVRLFTLWLTCAIGAVGCLRLWLARARWPSDTGHFDALAPVYAAQLSPATRERVVLRKTVATRAALEAAGITAGARLLDAGCGQGWYAAALARVGYAVTAVDLAYRQVAAAQRLSSGLEADRGARPSCRPQFATASVMTLPFGDGTFDAAMVVNVLHHVGDASAQASAMTELARVVRPGGRVIVHEINTTNLLFRLYMVYLFPLWRRIDLGTEWWLDPLCPPRMARLRLVGACFYTFLPDFTPAWLSRRLSRLEARLERTSWARYGAHFTLVYARGSDSADSADGAQEAFLPGAYDEPGKESRRPGRRPERCAERLMGQASHPGQPANSIAASTTVVATPSAPSHAPTTNERGRNQNV